MKSKIGIIFLIIFLGIMYCAGNFFATKTYLVEETEPSEKQVYLANVNEKFTNNQDSFEKLKEYYTTLDYKDIFESRGLKNVIRDGVQYKVYKESWCYVLSTTDYSGFESVNFSRDIIDIENMIGSFQGMYIGINKETYELEYLKVDVSNYDMGLKIVIVWDEHKVNAEHKTFTFPMDGNWGIDVGYMVHKESMLECG